MALSDGVSERVPGHLSELHAATNSPIQGVLSEVPRGVLSEQADYRQSKGVDHAD